MPRISGISIPDTKHVEIALTYIYGIGPSLSRKILKGANVNPQKKASELDQEEISRIKEIIDGNYKIEGELRREVMMNVKRLKDIGAWRGLRHIKRLPARGQRTKTNTRTIRGNVRKTVGSGRKPPAQAT
jgi:small subunit ribosomal protein S13